MKRTVHPFLSRAVVGCAILVLTACTRNTGERPFDPAVTALLGSQPDDHGAFARWITQFMHTEVAAQHLQATGYQCTESVDKAATALSVEPYPGFERKSYVCRDNAFIAQSVVTLQTSPNGLVAKASGVRWYAFSDKAVDEVQAPGITFANAQALADFVADAQEPSQLSTHCASPDAPSYQCAGWASARANGWPKRGTQPIAAGTAQQVVERIKHAGFSCPPWNRQNMGNTVDTGSSAAEDVLWIECRAQALLDGQTQTLRVGVSMEDGTARTVRTQVGSDVQDIALIPKPEDEDPSSRRVMLRDNTGRIRQVELITSAQGQASELTTLLQTADQPTRRRLLRVMLDMTENNLSHFSAQSAAPVLQQIDSGAALFGLLHSDTLAAELPTWSLTPLGKTVSVKTRAALAMARCLQGDAPAAKACYAPVRVTDPQVHTLLLAALEEVKPDTALLAPDHVVAQRLKFLRAVLGSVD